MAPDFIVEMLDGSKVTLVENRGKVVLVSFWATWCPPCRLELSHMQKDVIDRFAGEDLVVLPISRGEERKTVESYISKMGYTFPVGLDTTQAIYSKYASNYVPRSVVIDREGMVVYVGVGYDEQIAKEIEQAIFEALQK
jgi:peroxiredoxin